MTYSTAAGTGSANDDAATSTHTENPLEMARGSKMRGASLFRALLFFAIAYALQISLIIAAQKILGPLNFDRVPGLSFTIPAEFLLAVATVVVPCAIMLAIYREPLVRFGFGRSARLKQLAFGILTGLGAMSLEIVIMALLGGTGRWTFAPLGTAALSGLGYVVLMLLVAVAEEGFLRGYGLVQLARAISFWPAAIATSFIFVLLHLVHKTESIIGLAQVGIIGLILAYSFRRSGALWFAIGCHAAWDFAETYVYGVPDSGVTSPDALSHLVLKGPEWVTGGVTGPEGSWLVFPALAGIAAVVHFALPSNGPANNRN